MKLVIRLESETSSGFYGSEGIKFEREILRHALSHQATLALCEELRGFAAHVEEAYQVSEADKERNIQSEIHAVTVRELGRKRAEELLAKELAREKK